jgi:hypothetical protein
MHVVLARCPACSERFPIPAGGRLACPFCRAVLEISIERAASAPIEPSPGAPVKKESRTPWEERAALRGFLLTIWSAMTAPAAFFRSVGSVAIGGAPSFALLILVPAIAIQAGAFLVHQSSGPIPADTIVRYAGLVLLASMLSIAYLGTFYQLACTVMTGRRVAVPATVRALCFGFAPMVLAIVPVAGFAVGLGWSLFLHAIALREIHGLTPLKSLAVVALPIALVAVKLW